MYKNMTIYLSGDIWGDSNTFRWTNIDLEDYYPNIINPLKIKANLPTMSKEQLASILAAIMREADCICPVPGSTNMEEYRYAIEHQMNIVSFRELMKEKENNGKE